MTTYSDDFNRTELGPDWIQWASAWFLDSGRLAPASSGGTQVINYAHQTDSADHYVEVDYAAGSSSSMGVFIRSANDVGSYYLLRHDGATWDIFRQSGGSFTSIASSNEGVASGDRIRFEAEGNTLRGYRNGVQFISVVDSVLAQNNYVGFRTSISSTFRYDNFVAGDLADEQPVTRIYLHNGTDWVPAAVKLHDGSGWIPATI